MLQKMFKLRQRNCDPVGAHDNLKNVSVRSTAWLLARKATTGGVGHRNEASARYG
jgi:hypothetical protein